MAVRTVKVWFDPEADLLKVTFAERPGYFRPTRDGRVMERVDVEGNVLRFSILGVSTLAGAPLEVALPSGTV